MNLNIYNILLDTVEIQNAETVPVPDPRSIRDPPHVTCHKRWIFLLSHSNLTLFTNPHRLPKSS